MNKIKLIRVSYGKRNTPLKDREYQINGSGPVGTLEEYQNGFKTNEFEIEDTISPKDVCKTCGKDMEEEDCGDDDCRKMCYVCPSCLKMVRNF